MTERSEPEPSATKPCPRCGAALYLVGEELCPICKRDDGERAREHAAEAGLIAIFAKVKADWESTPHRCACGAKVLRLGVCSDCLTTRAEQRERLERIAHLGIPKMYDAEFGSPEIATRVCDARALKRAEAAVADRKVERISFYGAAGTGKTTLACACLVRLALDRNLSGHFVDARRLSVARAEAPLGEQPALVTYAMGSAVVVLDDLGVDDAGQRGSAVADVVRERHAERRLLICTLAVAPGDLAARYGDGFARRLLEDDGSSVVIEVAP